METKVHFSKGDLISGIVLGVLAIIFALSGAFGEEGPGILAGPIIIAVMVFCAYGKIVLISYKDSSTVGILTEGFAQGEQIQLLAKKLGEKGVTAGGGK